MALSDVIPLHNLQEVPNSAQLKQSLEDTLRHHAQIHAVAHGTSITELHIDCTNLELSLDNTISTLSPIQRIDRDYLDTIARGSIAQLRIFAEPLWFADCPVQVHLTASDVQVRWVRCEDGGLGLAPDGALRFTPDATLTARAETHALETLFAHLAEQVVAEEELPVVVTEPNVTLEPHGVNGIAVNVSAVVKWKLFKKRVSGLVKCTVSNSGVLSLDEMSFDGPSMIVKPIERKVRQRLAQHLDLSQRLPKRFTLSGVNIAVATHVSLRAQVQKRT